MKDTYDVAIIFSDPTIAVVGRSFASLMEEGVDFVIGESDYKRQGRALMADRNRGIVRIYARKEDGGLLGGELLAPDGEHLAHLINWMVGCKLSTVDILAMPFYHPTLEEGLRRAFRDALKKSSIKKSRFELSRCEEPVVYGPD